MSNWPPEYTIRHSPRAKRISLHIDPVSGLEVVIPKRASKKQALKFLNDKRHWVLKNLETLSLKDQKNNNNHSVDLPQLITLPYLSNSWDVRYHYIGQAHQVAMHQLENKLIFSGNINGFEGCLRVFKKWLKKQAKLHLTEKMQQLSWRCDLNFNQLSFRGQKTLWGSCSHEHNISLNYKLLFLPSELVQYVLVHELCHTVYFDHSAKFWALVARHEPNYKLLKNQMRKAEQFIPRWYWK